MTVASTRRRTTSAVAFALAMFACIVRARAQTPPTWRPMLLEQCARAGASGCERIVALNPDVHPTDMTQSALLIVDTLVRRLVPFAVDAAGHSEIAGPLRELPAANSREAVPAVLAGLLTAYVALLPVRARRLARGFVAESWWQDLDTAQQTTEWQRAVRDDATPAGTARGVLANAARIVGSAGSSADGLDRALTAFVALGGYIATHGGNPGEVVNAMIDGVAALPRTPVPAGPPDAPTRAQVVEAMTSALHGVERCVGVADMRVDVRAEFGSDGHVTSATVVGPLAGSGIAACVRIAVLDVTVPAFSRPTFSVVYPYVIHGAHPDRAVVEVVPVDDGASGPPEPPPAPPTPAQPLPDFPSDGDVDTALANVTDALRQCAPHPRGAVSLALIFGGDGAVQSAHASGPFPADTLSCMEAAAMNAHVPRFAHPALPLTRRVRIGR